VNLQSGIPLIGRSLPIKNKTDEFDASRLVGEAFCNDFKVINLKDAYEADIKVIEESEGICMDEYPIACGNIQARKRMEVLYNLASIHHGIVLSTDNQTEYQLGFWTLHGDVGDFDPLQDLWKTEVYDLARYIFNKYDIEARNTGSYYNEHAARYYVGKMNALKQSISLIPTDGLGISNSDLDQIGAKSYADVDDILRTLIELNSYYAETSNERDNKVAIDMELSEKYGDDVVSKVWDRHVKSEFKRKKAPIYIERSLYEN
jgi:NH3-dependent NAD+ synthetase